jgi:HPt (histidine-containing phosphotransfer) domain-containing protein
MSNSQNGEALNLDALSALDELSSPETGDLVAELLNVFLASTPVILQKIDDALAGGDFISVSEEAHGLKSSSKTLGAAAVGDVCQKIETEAKSPSPQLSQLVRELRTRYDAAAMQMGDVIKQRSK